MVVKGSTAFINVYFANQDILDTSITVNLVNKINGSTIKLIPTSIIDKQNNKLSFSVQLPENFDLSSYTLIETSASGPNGNSTLVSSQPSNQLILNQLADNALSHLNILAYIFSSVMLFFIIITKLKGHFTAE